MSVIVSRPGCRAPGGILKLYYHRRGVLVTSSHVQVGSQIYHVADLTELMQARRSTRPGVAIGIELALALVEAALGAPIVDLVGAPLDWFTAPVGLLMASTTVLVSARRSRPRFELRGSYRTLESSCLPHTTLLHTTNASTAGFRKRSCAPRRRPGMRRRTCRGW